MKNWLGIGENAFTLKKKTQILNFNGTGDVRYDEFKAHLQQRAPVGWCDKCMYVEGGCVHLLSNKCECAQWPSFSLAQLYCARAVSESEGASVSWEPSD